jgi:transcription initiation factor IIF auxiliary subunit
MNGWYFIKSITLETISDYQRMLEGECYMTGSMIAVAVLQIRKCCVDAEKEIDSRFVDGVEFRNIRVLTQP